MLKILVVDDNIEVLDSIAIIKKQARYHEAWTLDAKEEIQLADQTYASWLVMAEKLLNSALFGYPTSG